MDSRLVLKRIEVEVMAEKMSIKELMAALIVEDVLVDKVKVGLAKVMGIVAKEFVVDVLMLALLKPQVFLLKKMT